MYFFALLIVFGLGVLLGFNVRPKFDEYKRECSHDWGKWERHDNNRNYQVRFCKNCNEEYIKGTSK